MAKKQDRRDQYYGRLYPVIGRQAADILSDILGDLADQIDQIAAKKPGRPAGSPPPAPGKETPAED